MIAKTAFFLCLFVLQAYAVRDSSAARSLRQTVTAFASASSTGGTVRAEARGTAISTSDVRSNLVERVSRSIEQIKDGGDVTALALADARAFARAAAVAYAAADISISSNSPTGAACASAFASAQSSATAFAVVLVDVLAKASNSINFEDARRVTAIISGATANAFATAQASACAVGEFDIAITRRQLRQQIVRPYAAICALAYAAVRDGNRESVILVQRVRGAVELSTSANLCQKRLGDCCSMSNSLTSCDCLNGCVAEKLTFPTVNAVGFRVTADPNSVAGLPLGGECVCA